MLDVSETSVAGEVTLTCSASGGPDNSFVISRFEVTQDSDSTITVDLAADPALGGQYRCNVTNAAGTDFAEATVNSKLPDTNDIIMLHVLLSVLHIVLQIFTFALTPHYSSTTDYTVNRTNSGYDWNGCHHQLCSWWLSSTNHYLAP